MTTPPVRVRIAGTFGRLINVSATGALVQIQRELQTQRVWPLVIDMESEPVDVPVRVIRSLPVSVQQEQATWRRQEFAVAVAFTALSPSGRALLLKLCGASFSQFE